MTPIRRTATITVAALAILGAGCANRTANSTSTTTTVPKATTTTTTKTDVFVDGMREKFPTASRSALVDIGRTACDTIDAFGSITDALIGIALDPKWTVEQAGDAAYTFGLAVPAFCPEYLTELRRLAR